ncbi:MAG: TonB-dependent receptor [Alphaproteobacteria bacterium PA4]|nr:MAG: TonB-dependent receptor [Alphaproteobacteria bacterium PA4]
MTTDTSAFKAALLASIACAGLVTPMAAFAQTAAAAAASTDENDESNIIIITASKRSATLQDTPISVAVTGRAQIEESQIRDLKDLQTLVPSLRVNQLQSSANTNFIIRGFGNGANNAGIEPSVGVFIDGVYRSRSAAQIGDLPNLERVEVLRGPQSTLFGKNASAGIISIVTSEPKFDFGGNAEVSYGNYNAIIVKGGVTGGLTDKIAVSLDGNYNKRDGYGFDVGLNQKVNERNRWGVRGSLLFKASEDFKVRLIADYDKIDENCCLTANIVDGPTGNAVRAVGGRVISNQPFAYVSASNIPSSNKIANYGISGQIDWNLSDTLALTSITAYRRVDSDTNQDSDFTSADLIGNNENHTNIKTFTQELRLASTFDGPVNFLLGGFYFNEKIDIDSNLTFGKDFKNYANALSGGAYSSLEPTLRALLPGTPAGTFGAQGQGVFEKYNYKNEAYSIFGQVDFEPVEGLTLTAGGNYTHDKKAVTANVVSTDVFSGLDLVLAGVRAGVPATVANTSANPFLGLRGLQFLPPFLNFPNSVEDGKTNDSKFTYTLRAAYKFSDSLSTYATYATGFKASSFNLSRDSRPTSANFIPGSPAQVPAPAPSAIRSAGLAVTNLTTGTRFADPENATVYEVGMKGQFDGFSFNLALFKQSLKGFQGNIFTGTGFVLGNAEKQSTTGIELDALMSPIKNLTITTNFTYLNPKFDSFTGGTALQPGSFATVPTNLTGQRPAGIPEFSYTLGATYSAKLNDTMKATFHVDYFGSSPVLIAQGLNYKREEQSLNASITLAVTQGLEVSIWGRNLADSQYITTLFPGVAQSGSLQGYPSQPRTYGGLVRYRF